MIFSYRSYYLHWFLGDMQLLLLQLSLYIYEAVFSDVLSLPRNQLIVFSNKNEELLESFNCFSFRYFLEETRKVLTDSIID